MEALAAISLAGNIVGFVDVGCKLISQIQEISTSTSGATDDSSDMQMLIESLSLNLEGLTLSDPTNSATQPTASEEKLQSLALRCAVLAGEMSTKLKKLTVDENSKSKGLSSIKVAVRSAWGKKDLEEKMARMNDFRSEFQLNILTSLKKDYDLVSIQNSERYECLEDQGRRLLQMIVQGHEIFEQGLATQTAIIQNLHQTSETNIKRHFDQSHAEVIQAVTKKQKQEQSQDNKRREDAILQHLSFPTMEVRYENIDPAHAKTFNWIFESSKVTTWYNFSKWLEGSDEKLYWINGKAGSGKSTLMKYIVEDSRTKEKLEKWAGNRKLTMASFFFWISGMPDQCSQTGLLRSLLHYLLGKSRYLIRNVFPDLWEHLDNPNMPVKLRAWTVPYASEALKNLLGRDLGKVALFIDGLDEYHGEYNDLSNPEHHEKDYREIIDRIQSFTSLNRGNIKICFSSRPYQIFHKHFDQQPKLSLQDLTHGDIYRYTEDKLLGGTMKLDSTYLSDRKISMLVSQVVNQAESIFLWVRLVVKSLLDGIDNSDDFEILRSRLKLVPSNLMGLYRHMLSQIEPQYLHEASRVFAMADIVFSMAEKNYDPFGEGSWADLTLLGLYFALDYSSLKTSSKKQAHVLSNWDEMDRAVKQINLKLKTRCLGLIEIQHLNWDDEDEDEDIDEDTVEGAIEQEDESDDEGEDSKQTRVQDLPLQYIHRSVKEFLDLDDTKTSFGRVKDNDYDPKVSLIWSAVQRIRIFETTAQKSETRLHRLVDLALLLAVSLLHEGKPSPVELLDLLDTTMQLRQSQHELSWVTKAIDDLGFCFHWRYRWPYAQGKDPEDTAQGYGNIFVDDFLSLAISLGLTDYVALKIAEQPFGVKKLGRPYLDYALTREVVSSRYELLGRAINPKMVRILLQAGADVNEHCPTLYAAYKSAFNDPIKESNYTTWTPWKSALDSVSWYLSLGNVWKANLDTEQCEFWLEVFKLLVVKEPDVSVKTWLRVDRDSSKEEPITVSEIIANVFGEHHPKDTAHLLARVERLSCAQKCPIYQRRQPVQVMERLRKTLVPHLEMTEAQEAYWGLEDKVLL